MRRPLRGSTRAAVAASAFCRRAYSAAGATSVTSAAFVESGRTSADLYTQLTTGLGERLSTALHDRAVALRSAALRDTAIILGAVFVHPLLHRPRRIRHAEMLGTAQVHNAAE